MQKAGGSRNMKLNSLSQLKFHDAFSLLLFSSGLLLSRGVTRVG